MKVKLKMQFTYSSRVGAFPEGMQKLKEKNLWRPFSKERPKTKLWNMPWDAITFEQSEEYQLTDGLGIIEGRITKLSTKSSNINLTFLILVE